MFLPCLRGAVACSTPFLFVWLVAPVLTLFRFSDNPLVRPFRGGKRERTTTSRAAQGERARQKNLKSSSRQKVQLSPTFDPSIFDIL